MRVDIMHVIRRSGMSSRVFRNVQGRIPELEEAGAGGGLRRSDVAVPPSHQISSLKALCANMSHLLSQCDAGQQFPEIVGPEPIVCEIGI